MISKQLLTVLFDKSSIRLFVGFGLIILLMLLLLLHISNKMEIAHEQLRTVVHNHLSKTVLVAQMQSSARDRRLSLQEMLLQDDPLEREETWERFIGSADSFMQALEELEKLPFTSAERLLLEEQREFTRDSSPILNQVLELARNEELEKARELFLYSAIPLQKGAFLAFHKMEQLQKQSADMLIKHAHNSYEQTRATLWVLGFTAVILSVLIATYVVQRTVRMTKALNHAKAVAESSNEAKSRFIANMSHELRTPLNAILGYSDMLLETTEDIDDADLRDEIDMDLKHINAAGNRLLVLVSDVLDLSRLEAGNMDLNFSEFNIKKLCIHAQQRFLSQAEKNHNHLYFDCVEPLAPVYADEAKVQQILINLVSNATKFTHNGSINLYLRSDADVLLLTVQDTGIGITTEQQNKIFEAFSQVDLSSTRRYEGSGLGLAISQRFAKMMGGDISLSSQENQGATFTFTLPQAAQQENRKKQQVHEEEQGNEF